MAGRRPQRGSAGPKVWPPTAGSHTLTASTYTHANKQVHTARIHIRSLPDTHARTLQLIGRQVSGEEEKVPVQHMQAEYAISSS